MQRFYSIVVLLLSTAVAFSQGITNNGNLQIHTGANMAAFVNFTNASTGALVNNGTFYVRGGNEPSRVYDSGYRFHDIQRNIIAICEWHTTIQRIQFNDQ